MKRLLITNSTLLLLSLVKDATIFNYFQTHYKTVMDPTIASTMETFSVFLKKKNEFLHQLLNSFLRVAV
jgi:hypothetical protein